MNARTVLPLAILTALFPLCATVYAADTPARSGSGRNAPTSAGLADNEAQAKARAALYSDAPVAAQPTKPTPKPSAVEPKRNPEPVIVKEVAARPASTTAAPATVSTLSGPQPDNEAQAKARAALYADEPTLGVAEPEPQPAPAQSVPEVAEVTEQATPQPMLRPSPISPSANPLTHGMEAPALPTNASQQAQLDALLQQYRADAISAAEYHTRRAEILAEK